MKGMQIMLLAMIIPLLIVGLWNTVPAIKNSVHFVLDPTFGSLLNWNTLWGMIIIVIIIVFISTLVQKYGTDQVALKKIKEEQKFLQEEIKKYKNHPEKLMEFQKKQLEIIPKTFDLTMKPLLYTIVPFILFYKWFGDYFTLAPYKFFGFMSWIWFYIITSIIVSTILRKIMKVH